MKKFTVTFVYILINYYVHSQVTYESLLPVENVQLYNMIELSDETLLAAGRLDNSLFLVKWNQNGDTVWTRHHVSLPPAGIGRLMTGEIAVGNTIIDEDGNFIETLPTAGNFKLELRPDSLIYSNTLGFGDVELTMIDRDGIIHWTRPLIAPPGDGSFLLGRTSEGFFSCVAANNMFPPETYIHISRYDLNGDLLDSSYIHQSPSGAFTSANFLIHPSTSGALILVNYAFSTSNILIRTDQYGDTLWTRSFGNWMEDVSDNIVAGDLKETPWGTFILSGNIMTTSGNDNPRFIEFDQDGTIICVETLPIDLLTDINGTVAHNSIGFTDSFIHLSYGIWESGSPTNFMIGHIEELCLNTVMSPVGSMSEIIFDPIRKQISGAPSGSNWIIYSLTGQVYAHGFINSDPQLINLADDHTGMFLLRVVGTESRTDQSWRTVVFN
ncbi:MAG: hypothetical protein M3R08_03950 [Bacteroidota bacterium]|nr:hypothetical protein [Bacteroidota bacterium]